MICHDIAKATEKVDGNDQYLAFSFCLNTDAEQVRESLLRHYH